MRPKQLGDLDTLPVDMMVTGSLLGQQHTSYGKDRTTMTIEPIAPTLALLGPLGWPELIVLAILGVLIFGRRLPEMGKSLGRGIVELKKGLSGIADEVNNASTPKDDPNHIESRSATTVETAAPESESAAPSESSKQTT